MVRVRESIKQTTLLEKHQRKELLSITRFFAGKVLTSDIDRERSERKFTVLREFLEDSWTFQQTLEEGRVEGRVEGRLEGRIEGQRQGIEAIMQVRFPDLWIFTRRRITSLTDLEKLQQVLLTVSTAQTEDEVEQYLRAL